MTNYHAWVPTDDLLAKVGVAVSTDQISFTRMIMSSDKLAQSELAGLKPATLTSIKSSLVTGISDVKISDNVISVTSIFTSIGNKTSFDAQTILLVAKYKGAEFIAAATIADKPQSMDAENEVSVQEFTVRPQFVLFNSSAISTKVESIAAASKQDVEAVRSELQAEKQTSVHITGDERIEGTKTFITDPVNGEGKPYITADGVKNEDSSTWQKQKITADDGAPVIHLTKEKGSLYDQLKLLKPGIYSVVIDGDVDGNPLPAIPDDRLPQKPAGEVLSRTVQSGPLSLTGIITIDGDAIAHGRLLAKAQVVDEFNFSVGNQPGIWSPIQYFEWTQNVFLSSPMGFLNSKDSTVVDRPSYVIQFLPDDGNLLHRDPNTSVVKERADFTNLTVGGKPVATSDDLKSIANEAWTPLTQETVGHTETNMYGNDTSRAVVQLFYQWDDTILHIRGALEHANGNSNIYYVVPIPDVPVNTAWIEGTMATNVSNSIPSNSFIISGDSGQYYRSSSIKMTGNELRVDISIYGGYATYIYTIFDVTFHKA